MQALRRTLPASRLGARSASASSVFTSPYKIDLPSVPLTEYITENFDKFGDKPALVDGPTGRTIKYSELNTRIGTVAQGFAARGVQDGDVVDLHLPNMPEYVVAFQSIAALGATNTTSNPLYTATELKHQFRDANAKYVVTAPPFLETVKAAAKDSNVKDIFVVGEDSGKFLFANDGKTKAKSVPLDPKTRTVALVYSSGTTGLPKGVELTHANLTANVAQMTHHPDHNVDLQMSDVCLGLLPQFHIYGLSFNVNTCLRQGATVVSVPRFDPVQFLEVLSKYKVTYAPLVPPIIAFLARHPLVAKYDLSALRVIFSGAAPLDAETQKAVHTRIPNARSCQGYGMSETSPVTHIPAQGHNIPGCIGTPLPNTSAKIVSTETGADLPPGPEGVGELCIQGPQVMKGYLNNASATANTIKGGWLHTGDIAWRDGEGNTFIVDRLKELIKHKGFQVAPAELEGLLLQHPEINDVAVVGAPDERAGELPVAFVVHKAVAVTADAAAKKAAEAEVKAWIQPKVAEYKVPARVLFVEAIPKSASGKILRRVLKEQVAALVAAQPEQK